MLTQKRVFAPPSRIRPGVIPTAQDILIETPVASPLQTNLEIQQLFSENPQLVGLPVIEDDSAIGLINRNIFMDSISRPFHKEIFGKKSCIAFMDKTPLIVDRRTSIQELSFMVVNAGKKALSDGFIIVDEGRYVGMGMGHELVRMVSDMQAQKNHIVMESIAYASVIQKSYLRSSREDMNAVLKDHFMHWEPRDIVGGDYYYFSKYEDGFFAAIMDCSGHGVPGAFMTLIMASTLDHLLTREKGKDPAEMLSLMNRTVKVSLGQVSQKVEAITGEPVEEEEARSDDGMDAAFLWFDMAKGKMTYAGARMPVFVSGEEDIVIHEGKKKGVGYADTAMDYEWENREIQLQSGDCVYVTTDGIIDQIGGKRNIALGKRQFSEIIRASRQLPMTAQRESIMEAFCQYQGNHSRRDDITIFGFRV